MYKVKKLAVIGSTGSIGTQSLDVVRKIGGMEVISLAANENIELLYEQILEFKPRIAAVVNEEKCEILKKRLAGSKTKIVSGVDGLLEAAVCDEVNTVILSVVGNSGIRPAFEAINAGKDLALANKETLVSAGQLIMDTAREKGIKIYPLDSEHSAIFQCLQGNKENKIKKIILTASGGPFRGKNLEYLKNVTVADALSHPTWSMGKKITIDSATLMNKGLELIEARWLFDVPVKDIEIVVHPQSIVHSAVEFEDNSIIAQMGMPDMRIPISYALTYPFRMENNFERLNLFEKNNLTFEKPDFDTFKCLKLAYRAIKTGGTMPAVMNGANEKAVYKFLEGKLKFIEIPEIIEQTMNAYNVISDYELEDVIEADKWAKAYAESIIKA
ncbi:MAG: 1-deoxy-D-xylulose-5-phosphate reductoisomerase [Firmicutes bacterium]|nr:1-deoxy-D-xylulose-5-phosphate reductoisomerase [Bacillota bacterium]